MPWGQKWLLSVADLKLTLDAEGAVLPNGNLKADLVTALSMSLDGKTLSVKNLHAQSGALDLKGNLKGVNLDTKSPAFNGQLELAEFNLREWMTSQGMDLPATSDPKALGRLAASLTVASKGTSTNLNKLLIQLDDTRITGNAILRGAAAAFKLNVDAINLDRYMSQAQGGKAQARSAGKTGSSTSSNQEQLFPVASLRKLNLNGSVNIGQMTVNKLLTQKVQFTIKAKNGLVQTAQRIGGFYKGSYSGNVDLNLKGKIPRVKINSNLSKVHMGSLIKAVAGQDRLTGQGHYRANLAASGNSVAALKRTLNGKMDIKFLEGAVKGINLAHELRRAQGLLTGKPVASSSGPVQTDFSQITGSAVVKQGVVHNSDFKALSPFLRVTGKGAVNLVNETLDYTTEVYIVGTAKGQGGHDLAALEELKRKKIGVPVRFSGPLAAPKWNVQWKKVLLDMKKDELKSALEKKLLGGDKKKDGEPASAEDQLKEQLLKGLFK